MTSVDIIIPYYNSRKFLNRVLGSIVMQDTDDILLRVLLVDDCSNEPFEDVVAKFNTLLNIKILRTKVNSGAGVARQIGIDASDADYIMFIDADDALVAPNAVTLCVKLAKDNNSDVVICDFNEECEGGNYPHQKDQTFMHGKMYRTKFIKDNNIRFNESRTNEDGVFNAIALTLASNAVFYGCPIYQWCDNKNSTVRSCDYNKDFIHTFVINAQHAYGELYQRKVADCLLCGLIVKYGVTMYGYYLEFIDKYDRCYLEKYLKHVKDFMDNSHFYSYYHRTKLSELKRWISTNDIVKQNIKPASLPFDKFVDLVKEIR